MDNSFSIFIKSCDKVESIVWEESSSIESFGKQMSDGLSGGHSFDFEVINFKFCFHDLFYNRFTLVSSQKSAYIPEVARIVLSVS